MMYERDSKQCIFRSYNMFSVLCILMEILSHASAKTKTKRLKVFNISHFYGSFSGDLMAVKGIKGVGWGWVG